MVLLFSVQVESNEYVNEVIRKENRFRNSIQEEEESDKPKLSSKEIYANLKKTIASVRESCGQVCDTSVTGKPDKYYEYIEKEVNCEALFSNPDIDVPSQFTDAPRRPPKWLAPEYTYGGRVPIVHWYLDDTKGISHYTNWSMDMVSYLTKR